MPTEKPPTLYTLTADEIEWLLCSSQDKGDVALGEQMKTYDSPERKLSFLQQSRESLRRVISVGKFVDFTIEKIIGDADFYWTMQLKFGEYMDKVHHRYGLHFCYNPIPYFGRLDDLEEEIKEIQANPTLIAEEDDERIGIVRKNIAVQNSRDTELRAACTDLDFDATVSESKYKEGREGGTVIVFKIPAPVVTEFNDKRFLLKEYHLRLQTLS
jgi:signal recognition particle subunit SEC65